MNNGSQFNKIVNLLKENKIDVKDGYGNYKSVNDVIQEICDMWDEIDNEKICNAIGE